MPIIVVGADTSTGEAVVTALAGRGGELRAFVTDPAAGERLRRLGAKAAVGDVSDGTHVGGAALGAFGAVLVAEATTDGRERSFAAPGEPVVDAWAAGLAEAGVSRIVWVGEGPAPASLLGAAADVVAVSTRGRPPGDVTADIVEATDAPERH